MFAGDHRRFRSENTENQRLETGAWFAKAHHWQAFNWPNAGLAGWRRSADRTCLWVNSLQTGNFSGKLAVLGGIGTN